MGSGVFAASYGPDPGQAIAPPGRYHPLTGSPWPTAGPMTYSVSTAAALAFPLLLAVSPAPVETIQFAPKAGAALTKAFVTTTELELEDADIRMGGQPVPIEGMEMNQKAVQAVTVTDEYGAMKDGRLAKLSRTYDAITMERFEMQEISEDGRLYKESYRDTQLGLAGVGNQAEAGGHSSMTVTRR